jgi:hypothetical protein
MGRIASLPLWVRCGLLLTALIPAGAVWVVVASFTLLWGTGLFRFYAHPTIQWIWYFPYRHENARLDWWITVSAIVATIAVVPALCRVLWELFVRALFISRRQLQPLYGETSWASPNEMRQAGFSLRRQPR